MTDSDYLLLDAEAGTVPLVPRAPLGPFPEPQDYDHVLPFTPPAGRDLHFYRGQFCGIRIPGAPAVPGSNDANPELVMACLLDNYPEAIQDAFLRQYAENGYTHLQRSFGHALHYGSTLDQFIALSQKAQSYGLYADQWLIGVQESQPRDQDVTYWKPVLDPVIDAMLGAGVVDTACVGWQLDQFYQSAPGNPLISVIAYIGDKLPQTVPLYTHWVNEALAWWKTGGQVWSDQYQTRNIVDRFTWWAAMQFYLTGGHHQGDTTMARTNPKLYQDKMKDTLNPFCGEMGKGDMGQSKRGGTPKNFALDVFECTGQDQFNGTCSEDEGDKVGYILTCTTSFNGLGMSGYGNGGRKPDGTRL